MGLTPLYLKLRVDRTLVPEVGHHGGEHPVAGRLPGTRWPDQRRPEADVEDVEHLDDLAHEQGHLRKHVEWVCELNSDVALALC